MSTDDITLILFEDVRVVVPDTLDRLTPYVLREQQDWFDDEIKFLRRLLTPGLRIIDIGAKYGVYALSMAKSVGRTGQVFAFEPAADKADRLEKSIASNGFSQIVLQRMVVSDEHGTMQLVHTEDSEIMPQQRIQERAVHIENVPTSTLDAYTERLGWQAIDFLRIECPAAKIVAGGARFFNRFSPLVQYRVAPRLSAHMSTMRTFVAMGYDCYQLLPGLDLLYPFDLDGSSDPYLRQLFFCKKDRAQRLAAGGFLLTTESVLQARDAAALTRYTTTCLSHEGYHWRRVLLKFPYGQMLSAAWEATMAGPQAESEVGVALALYAMSGDVTLPASDRFGALEAALGRFTALCQHDEPAFLRLASLARIARAWGARSLAVGALKTLLDTSFKQGTVNPLEPFLAPCERFDRIAPIVNQGGSWVFAAALEAVEQWHDFSSFYSDQENLPSLKLIQQFGFASAEMTRRLELMQARFPAAESVR